MATLVFAVCESLMPPLRSRPPRCNRRLRNWICASQGVFSRFVNLLGCHAHVISAFRKLAIGPMSRIYRRKGKYLSAILCRATPMTHMVTKTSCATKPRALIFKSLH